MGVQHIKIIDDSFIDGNRDEKWCEDFANAIQEKKLKFLLRGSIRADKITDKILFNLKKAGFFSFSCGIENFSETALKRMNKGANLQQNLNALDLFKKYHIYVQAGQILFDPETTLQELNENYQYMKKYDWIISKGVFTEMFAAEGTSFTKLIDKKHWKTSNTHQMGNYKYRIIDEKVNNAHDALKKWHILHMGLYDKAIDPLTSPKALSKEELKIFYDIYMKIRHKNLEIMGGVLERVENHDREMLKVLPLPTTIYRDLAEWSKVNTLYVPKEINMAKKMVFAAHEPEKVKRLLEILQNEQGHTLLTAVEQTKIALTEKEKINITLNFLSDAPVIRTDKSSFEDSLQNDIKRISESVQECLTQAQVKPEDIQLVVLTGGSTEIPHIQEVMCSHFPNAELSQSNKLSSVGLGLAYDSMRRFGGNQGKDGNNKGGISPSIIKDSYSR